MRLAASAALLNRVFRVRRSEPSIESVILQLRLIALAILLLAGLWMPVAGALMTVTELWIISSKLALLRPGDFGGNILLPALGVALALVGPGAWSVDARLFGWKRIEIRAPKRR